MRWLKWKRFLEKASSRMKLPRYISIASISFVCVYRYTHIDVIPMITVKHNIVRVKMLHEGDYFFLTP